MSQVEGLPTSARVRAVFEDVLAAEDFQYAEAAPWARWLQALTDFLGDVLRRWWPDLADSQVRLIAWVTLALLAAVTLLAISRWALRGGGRRSRATIERSAFERPRDAPGWARRAREAAAAGRYREAATGLYQATLLHLDAAGLVRYREWKTPGDYAVEFSGGDAVRRSLVAFLSDFVELAFGPREPDAASFEALAARAAGLTGGAGA
jgi:hypothetical protein